MSLIQCAPWLFNLGYHEVSLSDAEAVKGLFASLSQADAKAELTKKSDEDGSLPLHRLAYRAHGRYLIEIFTAIFNAYPLAAKEKNSFGTLPLHYVAYYMGGAEGLHAIKLLLAGYPQAAKEKDSEGKLPLHLICYNSRASLEMVRELLSAYPEGIHVENRYGSKPYGPAAKQRKLPEDAIAFLYRAQQSK
jgi:ankyrin repeat protein